RDPDRPPTHSGGLLVSATGVTVLIYTLIEGPNIGWLSVRTGAFRDSGDHGVVALVAGAAYIAPGA
ncbi:hypothetical protein, partial [Mycobacterium szulgai]|uniref:hypothetical protein n=1 Tax=Mycobacterium szulgai TaxID=1787 RepID=UPI0021F39D97